MRDKVEQLQAIALGKYIESLDYKKELAKRDEASMDVYMMLTRDTIRSEGIKVKTDIMKDVDSKFDQIINLIKKS